MGAGTSSRVGTFCFRMARGGILSELLAGARLTVWADAIMRSIVALDGFDKRYRQYKELACV